MTRPTHSVAAIAVAIVVCDWTGAGPALADHGVVGAPAPQRSFARAAEPDTSVSFDLSTTRFEKDGLNGTFWTAAVYGEYWRGAFGAHARVPLHTLSLSTGQDRETGLGDIMLGGTFVVPGTGAVPLGLGIDLYLPAGDSDDGMGQGSFAVAPNARAAFGLPSNLAVHGTAGAIINTSSAEPTTFVEQRSDAELRFGAALAWQPSVVRVTGRATTIIPLAPGDARGEVFITAGPSVALELTHHWWLDAFAEVPVRSMRQYDWRAGLALGYRFPHRHTSAQEHGHAHAHEHAH